MTPDNRHKSEKMESLVTRLAADFLEREAGGNSLITVTRTILSANKKYATILFTVFPPEKEAAAADFASRRVGDFRQYVEKHSKIGRLPFFEFKIDLGEKNRQKIDEIAAKEKRVIKMRPGGEDS